MDEDCPPRKLIPLFLDCLAETKRASLSERRVASFCQSLALFHEGHMVIVKMCLYWTRLWIGGDCVPTGCLTALLHWEAHCHFSVGTSMGAVALRKVAHLLSKAHGEIFPPHLQSMHCPMWYASWHIGRFLYH